MKRLHYVNLIGVLALVVLCVAQWRHDRQLNLEINRLEKARLDLEGRLAEQERDARGLNADLVEFKDSLTATQAGLNETQAKLLIAERQLRQLTTERDQLRATLTNWAAAVEVRDKHLEQANNRIRELADELNASVVRFNELATNYNAVVQDLNELRGRSKPPP